MSQERSIHPVEPRQPLPGLHGLRAVAALAIVVLHTAFVPRPYLAMPPWLLHLTPNLWHGVTLFFVLSAFVLMQATAPEIGTPSWVTRYAIRRLFRIAPLFYAMMAYYVIEFPNDGMTIGTIVANLLFLFNFVPGLHPSVVWAGWTIGVEMPFYALLPLIVIFVRTKARASILLAACGAISVAARLLLGRGLSPTADLEIMSLASNLFAFAMGVWAWFLVRHRAAEPRLTRGLAIATVLGFAIAFLFASARVPPLGPIPPDPRVNQLLWVIPLGLLCAWQALAPARWLAGALWQWIGQRSYSVYLLHPPIIYVLGQHGAFRALEASLAGLPAGVSFLACVALSVTTVMAAAAVTFKFIEQPGQRFGRQIINRFTAGTRDDRPADIQPTAVRSARSGSVPRLEGLQGLRAVAALSIVIFHVALEPNPNLPVPPVIGRILPYLWVGVTLFFILSAYALLHANHRNVGKKLWVLEFGIKRLFRIAPLFYAMIIFNTVVFYSIYLPSIMFVSNFLFIFNFIPGLHYSLVFAGWTIGVEMPFYALMPLIMRYVRTGPQVVALLIGTAIISVAAHVLLLRVQVDPLDYVALSFPSNLVIFAVGIAVWHLVRRIPPGVLLQRALIAGTILTTLPLLIWCPSPLPSVSLADPTGRSDLLLWAIPLGLLCAWQAVAPSALLRSRLMQWIGERSFSVYLLHPCIIYLLSQHGIYHAIYDRLGPHFGPWTYLVCLGLTVPLVLTASAVTYAMIESPGQTAGRKLIGLLHVVTAYFARARAFASAGAVATAVADPTLPLEPADNHPSILTETSP